MGQRECQRQIEDVVRAAQLDALVLVLHAADSRPHMQRDLAAFIDLRGDVQFDADVLALDRAERIVEIVAQRLAGVAADDEAPGLPIACVTFYWLPGANPKEAVLISGIMQSIMLPMLAGAALYFRYQRCDARVQPGRVWDGFLWTSAVVMLATGLWAAYQKVMPAFLYLSSLLGN